jgi:hypothetical protein
MFISTLVLSGCDTINGVSRSASIHALPDLPKVKAKLESYAETKNVKFWQAEGGRPITLTGLKKADDVFYMSYTGGENVHGTLWFERNYKGNVQYHQSLMDMDRSPPQSWIDATWPVMKRIERDLENDFGLPEISTTLKIYIGGVEDPERKMPNHPTEPTPASVTRPAGQAARQP